MNIMIAAGGIVLCVLLVTIVFYLYLRKEWCKKREEKIAWQRHKAYDDKSKEDTKGVKVNESNVWYSWSDEMLVTANSTMTRVSNDIITKIQHKRCALRSVYSKTIGEFIIDAMADKMIGITMENVYEKLIKHGCKVDWKIKINNIKQDSGDMIGIIMGSQDCYEAVDCSSNYYYGIDLQSGDIRCSRGYNKTLGNCGQSKIGSDCTYPTFKNGDIIGIEYDIIQGTLSLSKNENNLGVIFENMQAPRSYTKKEVSSGKSEWYEVKNGNVGYSRLCMNICNVNNSYTLVECGVTLNSLYLNNDICDGMIVNYKKENEWNEATRVWTQLSDALHLFNNSKSVIKKGDSGFSIVQSKNINEFLKDYNNMNSNSGVLSSMPGRVVWSIKFDVCENSCQARKYPLTFRSVYIINGLTRNDDYCDSFCVGQDTCEFYGIKYDGSYNSNSHCKFVEYGENKDKYFGKDYQFNFWDVDKPSFYQYGDIMSIDLNIKEKTLSFWKNNKNLGILYRNLPINQENVGKYRLGVNIITDNSGCTFLGCGMEFDDCGELLTLGNKLNNAFEKFQEISDSLINSTNSNLNKAEMNKLTKVLSNLQTSMKQFDQRMTKDCLLLNEKARQVTNEFESNYKDWEIDEMMKWILSLENGKFGQYYGTLKKCFVKDNIVGSDLTELTRNDFRSFGVSAFRDRVLLEKHCQSLNKGDSKQMDDKSDENVKTANNMDNISHII